MDINLPDVIAEITEAFREYETALTNNDVTTLDSLFYDGPLTVRYGATENLYGFDEIKAFRARRDARGLARRLSRTVITTYGRNVATTATLFFRQSAPSKVGRQMQTWVRTEDGWYIVAAHVSVIKDTESHDRS